MDSKTSTGGSLMAAGQAELLDAIDQIRNHGLDMLGIPLPQLVVCGDRSSGKSSVLEAISGIRFPVKGGSCTRFATVVRLRRSLFKSARVTILPAESTPETVAARLRDFRGDDADLNDLSGLIDKATVAMGLDINQRTFSSHTLQLEISGPEQPHLALVDLPGIVHKPDSNQKDGDVLIRNLVREYMSQPRSISLIVVSANYGDELQEVTKLAGEIAPQAGQRMIGIITKPDTLGDDQEALAKILSYVRNEELYFHFGWHVVKNASATQRKDPTYDAKAAEEAFFKEEPWASLPASQLGIPELKKRIGNRLFHKIRHSVPRLIKEIESTLEIRQANLSKLVCSRESEDEKRCYLNSLAEKFSNLVEDGLEVWLEKKLVEFEHHGKRSLFRGQICALNDQLANDLYQYGRQFDIRETDSQGAVEKPVSRTGRYDKPVPITKLNFLHMIESKILAPHQALELHTTFPPYLIAPILHLQCKNWASIAEFYAADVFEATKTFLERIIIQISDDPTSALLLQNLIFPALDLRRNQLFSKVNELAEPSQKGLPYPTHPGLVAQLGRIGASPDPAEPKEWQGSLANWRVGTKLMMYAEAYYDFSQYNFIDNMVTLAVENCLFSQLQELFNPALVMRMSRECVEKLAMEPENVVSSRITLRAEVKVLNEALAACRNVKPRKRTVARKTTTAGNSEFVAKPTTTNFPPVTTTPIAAQLSPKTATTGSLQASRGIKTPGFAEAHATNSIQLPMRTATEITPQKALRGALECQRNILTPPDSGRACEKPLEKSRPPTMSLPSLLSSRYGRAAGPVPESLLNLGAGAWVPAGTVGQSPFSSFSTNSSNTSPSPSFDPFNSTTSQSSVGSLFSPLFGFATAPSSPFNKDMGTVLDPSSAFGAQKSPLTPYDALCQWEPSNAELFSLTSLVGPDE